MGGYLPWTGGTYLGWGYLPWTGAPTLDEGYIPWMGYLPWTGGTYPGWGYQPWMGAPTLDRCTYLGWGTPIGQFGQVIELTVCLLQLPAGGLSCWN